MSNQKAIERIRHTIEFYQLNDENNYDYSDDILLAMRGTINELDNLQARIDAAIEYINIKAIKHEIQQTKNILDIRYELKLDNCEFIRLEDILKGEE